MKLYLAIFVTVGGLLVDAASATAAPRKLVVLVGIDLPTHMETFHGQVRSALEAAAIEGGREVAVLLGPSWCATPDCFRTVARAATAAEVMTIAGGRNEDEGYRLVIELWRADGSRRLSDTGGCDFCTGPDMVAAAGSLARAVLARAPDEAEQRGQKPQLIPGPTLIALMAPSSSGSELSRDVAIAIAGVVVAGGGAALWWLDGRVANCESAPSGMMVCRNEYATRRVGIPLTVVGAATAAVGTILVIRDARSRRAGLAFGPGTVAVVGRF